MSPSREECLRWMRAHAEEWRDRRTGEVNCTGLAEAWAWAHQLDDEGGPLDDPDHWCWDAAVEVAEALA